jgi:hypothetical protein
MTISANDIAKLVHNTGLTPTAPAAEWENIADRLTFAFAGYAAGARRESDKPGDVALRDWGASLAADALRLMARIGIDDDDEDRRQGTWRTTELASEALAIKVAVGGPEAAALTDLHRHLEGLTDQQVDLAPVETSEDINVLLQRALFKLVPTLQVLAMAGDAVEQTHGGLVRRGGRVAGLSVPWLFQNLVASFKSMYAMPPKITAPGGRDRSPRDTAHLRWFTHLFELVRTKSANGTSLEAEMLRDIAARSLDLGMVDRNYDRLRTWIIAASGKE